MIKKIKSHLRVSCRAWASVLLFNGLFTSQAFAQFNNPNLNYGNLRVNIPEPVFPTFGQPIYLNPNSMPVQQPNNPNYAFPNAAGTYNTMKVPTAQDIMAKQNEINSFHAAQGISANDEALALINEAIRENATRRNDLSYYQSPEFIDKTKDYAAAFDRLGEMLTGLREVSLADACYTVEAAWGDPWLTRDAFDKRITEAASFIKKWLVQNGYDLNNNEALNKGIQLFMNDTLTITTPAIEQNASTTITHFPFTYDYDDFMAVADYRNYFITKSLATGTGQCNSLPGVYLLLAEQLGAQAYLCFAPQHAFIKYPCADSLLLGYEPTSGCKISDQWYVENMGINPAAIHSGIYLKTLTPRMVVANCMLDLASGYLRKFGAADGTFITACIDNAALYFTDGNNINAYLLRSSLMAHQLDYTLYVNGYKDLSGIQQLPEADELYTQLLINETVIAGLGYQPMPEELYLELMRYHEFHGKVQQKRQAGDKTVKKMFYTIP